MRILGIVLLIIGVVGCGSKAQLKTTPVHVSGQVSPGGQALSGMVMIFQPLGDGHVRELPLRKDGTFDGEMVPGEYAYYLAKRAGMGAVQAPIKLPLKYFEADMSRTVTVEPDKLLAIALN